MDETQPASELARRMIEAHEGYSSHPRPDAKGTVQIGFGTNLTTRGLSRGEADWLVIQDVRKAQEFLSNYPWYSALSERRKAVLIDMVYNLGQDGFQGFGQMIACLKDGNFRAAADEMLKSDWLQQVGSRALEDAELMRRGE